MVLYERVLWKERAISTGPQILVVDREYLIAMEAERILMDSMACTVRIAMPHDYAETMEAGRFDVVVVDAGVVEDRGSDAIRRQGRLGAAVIFTTLTNDSMERLPEFKGFASVAKPFVDEELLSAVAMALRLPELDI
ncbi:MAG: hypothetical protein SXG53_29520 [Pseudomonadota bacterium]|nr:hypothetical protein [Pseudomonadota bacterium]